MKYQKAINLLDNTQNKQSEFRTRNWVEINDESRIKPVIKLNFIFNDHLFDYGDAYVLFSETITITRARDDDAAK